MNCLQNLIELNNSEFTSLLRNEANIDALINQELSIQLLKRFAKRLILLSSSRYIGFTLKRILELDSQDISVLVALAWELWSVGEDEECRSNAYKAKNISPDNKWVLYLLVALADSTSDKILILEKLSLHEPENSQIKLNLHNLQSGKSNIILEFSTDDCMFDW